MRLLDLFWKIVDGKPIGADHRDPDSAPERPKDEGEPGSGKPLHILLKEFTMKTADQAAVVEILNDIYTKLETLTTTVSGHIENDALTTDDVNKLIDDKIAAAAAADPVFDVSQVAGYQAPAASGTVATAPTPAIDLTTGLPVTPAPAASDGTAA